MIGLRDNLTLSLTKLRTRRVRLLVTLVVSGLLFSVLIAGSLIVRGSVASLESFTAEGFGKRFFVNVFLHAQDDPASNATYIDRALAIEKQRLASQKAEAARLGIAFDAATQDKAVTEDSLNGKVQRRLNLDHPAAIQALKELAPTSQFTDYIQQSVAGYNVKHTYVTGLPTTIQGGTSVSLSAMLRGTEVAPTSAGYGPGSDPYANFQSSLQLLDNQLLEAFLLPRTNLAVGADGSIPILAPTDAVESLLGLKALPSKATSKAKLERLGLIRSSARNQLLEVCYRNAAAVELNALALRQAADAATAKTTPGYQKPSLVYAKPNGTCSEPAVATDARTTAEKTAATKEQAFARAFGAEPPTTTKLKFRIVGVIPALSSPTAALNPSELISSLFTTTVGYGWFASSQAALANPLLKPAFEQPLTQVIGSGQTTIEFADRASQKRYLERPACEAAPTASGAPVASGTPAPESGQTCNKNIQAFSMPYGNPMAVLYDIQDGFKRVFEILMLIIASLSAIVMMGTIGKIIADSRKETSVFRAVGAKRFDIAQIYIVYAALLASLAFALALGIGLSLAVWAQLAYSPGLSVQAVLSFNSPNLHKAFNLVAVNPLDLVLIYGFTLVTGLASALAPLLLNVRRSPIKDMREE